MNFTSPTKGELSFRQMMDDIINYITGLPSSSYKIIVGTDSQVRDSSCFITAVVVHRMGKGARYYYRKKVQRKISSLRQKLFYETSMSLDLGSRIARHFAESGFADLPVEIHIDAGNRGDTRELIKEVVGMVTGSGFYAKIKPDAYGASSVADKHTK